MVETTITEELIREAEEQIQSLRKEVDYDTRDYAIDFLVKQYTDDEFYIPDEYQRQFIWDDDDKNKFIESILLGLPIPFMFFSDTDDGRCEIIDGAQRTRTLEEFISGDLILKELKKLTKLNNFKYENLPEHFKRKFNKTTMRIIVLSESTSVEVRKEIFNRINTSGRKATPIEIRRGSYDGPFMEFIKECAENKLFKKLCPVSPINQKRFEHWELVLRFFALLYNVEKFQHRVDTFLDNFTEEISAKFDNTIKSQYKHDFDNMLIFVDNNFPNGFKKTATAKSTPRVRFEAISVGVAKALQARPDLTSVSTEWLESEKFKFHTTTHASNSPNRVIGRIDYVKNMLLSENTNAGCN